MNHTATNPAQSVIAIIPARYQSSRLPGKPLLEIANVPMILHVVERALAAHCVARVIVATDDERVLQTVRDAGHEAVMTSATHQSGSDRLAEVAKGLDGDPIIVNLQGDEPLIAPATIEAAVAALLENENADVATTCEPIAEVADVLNPDIVKVVCDENGRALYFSRAPIPFPRDAARKHGGLENALQAQPELLAQFRKHTGLYVYRKSFLLEYTHWQPSALEKVEALEQLRALEHGAHIQVVAAIAPSIGVDTEEDLMRVRLLLEHDLTVRE